MARTSRTGLVQLGTGAPRAPAMAPAAPAASSVRTTPRRSDERAATAAAARTANCQVSVSASASGTAAPRMAPIAAGPAPSRKARTRWFGAQAVEAVGAEEDERERGGERDGRGEQPAADAGRGVADDGDGLHDRARGDLAEGDGVEELRVGHPVVGVDGVVLHQRDDHEPAAVGQRADLERHPRQREQAAGRGRAAAASSGHAWHARRAGTRGSATPQASSTAPQPSRTSTNHGPTVAAAMRAGERVGDPPRARRGGACASSPATRPARRLERDGGHGGAGAGAGAEHPIGRRGGEEQRRQREDHDQAGDDEAEPADERAGDAAQPPRAEDRQLGRRRAGQQVASRRSRPRTRSSSSQPRRSTHSVAQQRDVRRRAAEADAADAPPLAQHDRQSRRRRRAGRRMSAPRGSGARRRRAGPAAATHEPIRRSAGRRP